MALILCSGIKKKKQFDIHGYFSLKNAEKSKN